LTELHQIGACLARNFPLRGLFGVDAILRGARVWPIEVNPRYSASVEVLERSLGFQALALHVAAAHSGKLPSPGSGGQFELCGKAIRYSERDLRMTNEAFEFANSCNAKGDWPVYADLPQPGTPVAKGEPLATAFATGGTLPCVVARLRSHWEALDRLLAAASEMPTAD
jgi:predicted ATP-grasp superfamily ATP-dependent carboligase